MSTLIQPTSPLPSHSPRLMCPLKEIRLLSKRAPVLLTHFGIFAGILCFKTPCFPCFLSCGFALMVPCLLALGSCLGYITSSLALLGAISCMLVVQHPWLLQVSLHLKSRLLGNGGLTFLSAIFVATPCYYKLFCFMVGPFMSLPLLMYYSYLATMAHQCNLLWFFFLFFLPLTDSLFRHLHMGIMSHGCPCDSL